MYTEEQIAIAKEKIGFMKRKCAKRGREFKISLEQMLEYLSVTHCQVTGMPLIDAKLTDKKQSYNTRTLDRADSSIGYLPSNVLVVCHAFNLKKSLYEDPNNNTHVLPEGADLIQYVRDHIIATTRF